MPFVVSTNGAVDPDAIKWLRSVLDTAAADADAPTGPSTQQRISAHARDIAISRLASQLRFGRDAPILNTSAGL